MGAESYRSLLLCQGGRVKAFMYEKLIAEPVGTDDTTPSR